MKRWLALLPLALCQLVQAEVWEFGLIGDVPYSETERRELPLMLKAMTEQNLAVIAHVGDIKSGRDRCDDALFQDRFNLFNASRVPFVLIAGDNEWTDCDRQSSGNYDPLERLDKLRSIFWSKPYSLGQQKLPLEQQAGTYREHARFQLGPVLFATLNIPGGGNNWGARDQPSAEYQERHPAVLRWMKESFALARQKKLLGIVLLFQANPGFKHFAQGLPHQSYKDFLGALKEETANFDGKVVVVHGDTHTNRVDHPLRKKSGKRMEHFTRVETHGYPLMGWTRGIIDTGNPALFRFETYNWPVKVQ